MKTEVKKQWKLQNFIMAAIARLILRTPFSAFLEAEGWQYLFGNSIPHASRRDVLYVDDLEQFLRKANPDLLAEEIRQIIDPSGLGGSDFATLHKVYGWMVDGIQFVPQGKPARMVALIDFENPENNIFRVVNQFAVRVYQQWPNWKHGGRIFSFM